jgi:hypothetical protein
MHTKTHISAEKPNGRDIRPPMPSLDTFMQRHQLSEETAKRVLKISSNVDQADAIAELMR